MAKTASKIIIAAVAGIAAGVVVGMLFAPKKGSKTRKKLRKTMEEVMEGDFSSVTQKIEGIKEAFSDKKPGQAEETTGK